MANFHLSQMCHNDTLLSLLRYCNDNGKTVATAEETGFVAENTPANRIPAAQENAACEGDVAPVSGDFLFLG